MLSFGVGSGYTLTGGPNANPEFFNMIMEILDGAIGSTFVPKSRKALKTNAKRRVPDPTNPFGNPLGFGLAL